MEKRIIFLSLFFFAFISAQIIAEDVITPQLQEKMITSEQDELLPLNIDLKDRLDPAFLQYLSRDLPKSERRAAVVNELKDFHSSSQSQILQFLHQQKLDHKVENIQKLWISNVIHCNAQNGIISQLAVQPGIESIDLDERRVMISETHKDDVIENRTHRDTTWNVTQVQADQVWDLGYTGQNVVVAVLDTGVNYNHLDLRDHLWEHPDYPNHGFDFINNDNDPMDDNGHGTHCAGTVAGDGTAGTITGMAPDATIMCVKMLDNGGSGTEFTSWLAIQYGVEMEADIMSMSFGWQHLWGVNRTVWRDVMTYALYAGTISSVAAGNEGHLQQAFPIPDNIRTPGDCPPPWLHPDQILTGGISSTVCVGATDCDDRLAYFSGRGPVTWEDVYPYFDYPYDPEMGLIRPDILAPGVDITSLAYYDDQGYESGWEGTSMATPCVSGIMALMLSKNPDLLPWEIDQIVETTVDMPQDPKNSEYGSGRINALNSVNTVSTWNQPPLPACFPYPANLGTDISPHLVLRWLNGGGTDYYHLYLGTDNPPTNIVNGDLVEENIFVITDVLDLDTTYYWKVDSFNDLGNAPGEIWQFSTLLPADEDFETGDFSAYEWIFSGDADWVIDDYEPFYGSFCAKSGPISDNQETGLFLNMYLAEADTLSFFLRTSCEPPMGDDLTDKVILTLDEEIVMELGGEFNWTRGILPITEGIHELGWIYQKDCQNSGGEDCVWLDFINFPEFTPVGPGTLDGCITLCPEGDPTAAYLMVDDDYVLLDEFGCFSVCLDYGYYDITAGCEGYQTEYFEDLYIPPGEIINLDIILYGMLPPSGFEAVLEGNNVYLSWCPPIPSIRPLLYYMIYRNFNGGNFNFLVATTNLDHEDVLTCDGSYGYYATSVYTDGESCPSDTVFVEMVKTSDNTVPEKTVFYGNYPNPFNISGNSRNIQTNFKFYLKNKSEIKLDIFNMKGEKVLNLLDSELNAGYHSISWDGKSATGEKLSSGIYIVRYQTDNKSEIQKCMLIK